MSESKNLVNHSKFIKIINEFTGKWRVMYVVTDIVGNFNKFAATLWRVVWTKQRSNVFSSLTHVVAALNCGQGETTAQEN